MIVYVYDYTISLFKSIWWAVLTNNGLRASLTSFGPTEKGIPCHIPFSIHILNLLAYE